MGVFSWFCQDTGARIVNDRPMHVVMCDDKGNQYIEECYEGYGVFGGKDLYELLAEMNGYKTVALNETGKFKVVDKEGKEHLFDTAEDKTEYLRQKGIDMAFDGYPIGNNPNLKWPSLTTKGWYCNGECPESDPDQGFPDIDYSDNDDDLYSDELW